jgi:Ca-activated chloride channel homolog
MHFAQAEYLRWLWALPALTALFLWSFHNRRRRLERLVSPGLIPQLISEFSRGKSFWRACLLVGFFLFGILALARPQWGARMETVRRRGVDIIVALDTSYSMNAEDVAATRLAKAKSEIRSLLIRLKGDRIGLLSFRRTTVVACPLTLDYGAALLFLDLAGVESMPEPGTSLAAAIQTAVSSFIAGERKYKVLILVTDGEDLEGELDHAIDRAIEAGVIIYTLGIGTTQGKPIPVRDAKGAVVEYRRDASGQIVISRLDERALAEIASRAGGRYFRATTSQGELDEMYAEVSQMEKKGLESRLLQNFEDRFQYPLVAALLCLAAHAWTTDRRGRGRSWRSALGHRIRNDSGAGLGLSARDRPRQ